MNYSLEKYKGKASRHQCPKCGDKNSFVYYVDEAGIALDAATVGRCNHESSCGYHYPPKQYFIDNPSEYKDESLPIQTSRIQSKPSRLSSLPFLYVEQSISRNSSFVFFLCKLFDRYDLKPLAIERLMRDYCIGATKDQSVIFWQIDINGKVRTGKIMKYNRSSGHRIKDTSGINWVHSILKKKGRLPDDWKLSQCLFGEHLLVSHPTKIVALVESEKSALILACLYPEYVWLATGGKSQLSMDKLSALKDRKVIMLPDVDGYDTWSLKAKELEHIGCKVVVSNILEMNTTDEERTNKIDLADWVITQISSRVEKTKNELTEAEWYLATMKMKNPAMQELIDVFGLKLL